MLRTPLGRWHAGASRRCACRQAGLPIALKHRERSMRTAAPSLAASPVHFSRAPPDAQRHALLPHLSAAPRARVPRHLIRWVTMQALGLGLNAGVANDVAQSLAAGEALLVQLAPAVLRTLRRRDAGVSMACVPFLTAHLARLKNAARRQNGSLPEEQRQGLLLVLEVPSCSVLLPAGAVQMPQGLLFSHAVASTRDLLSCLDYPAALVNMWCTAVWQG